MDEMSTQRWFSARIRLVSLVEPGGGSLYMDSVILFRAVDFPDAQERAVAIGRAREESYVNADGNRVHWKLVEVISLDVVGPEIADGAEVYSEFTEVEPGAVPMDAEFTPEASTPTQSI